MTNPDRPAPLPDLVESRLSNALADLQQAEALDLGSASNADLVTAFEAMRVSLFDMIQLARSLYRELGARPHDPPTFGQ